MGCQRKMPKMAVMSIILGGGGLHISLLAAAFSVFMLKSLVLSGLLATFYFNSFELSETQGTVTKITRIEHEDDTIYEIAFEFSDEFGLKHSNVSFAKRNRLQPGQNVNIEYVMPEPTYARIKGLQYHTNSTLSIFILLLVTVAFNIWPIACLIRNIRYVNLLQSGLMCAGRFKSCVNTATKEDDDPCYKVTFTFTGRDNETHEVSHISQQNEYDTDMVYDVFYHPQKPKRALVFQMLPGDARITEAGDIAIDVDGWGYLRLLIPSLYILAWIV